MQFCRQERKDPYSLEVWRHWRILTHVNKAGNVMISCPNRQVAEVSDEAQPHPCEGGTIARKRMSHHRLVSISPSFSSKP